MLQRPLVPVLGISEIMLAVIHSRKIIGSRSKTRIDGQRLLVRFARFLQGKKMVIGHTDIVPNNRRLQIGLLVCSNGRPILSPVHHYVGLGFGGKLVDPKTFALLGIRIDGRATYSLSRRGLPCEYTARG